MLVSSFDPHHSQIAASFSGIIHPTAIIADGACIGRNVHIGPYSIIGENVTIGDDCVIHSHVVIEGWTTIGCRNQIFTGAIIGNIPQDLKFIGEQSFVTIGDDNIIREYVTINRGTTGGGGKTSIGNHNLLMTGCHVAHDTCMGNHNIIANSVAIAGHVIIEDSVTIGGLCGIHQFCKLGRLSMIGSNSVINKHVLPFALIDGNPSKLYGLNVIRLRRNGYTPEARMQLQKAYKVISRASLTTVEVIEAIKQAVPITIDIEHLLLFLEHAERGVYR